MTKFLPIEEDLKIFNILNAKINIIKKDTNIEIKQSSESEKKKKEYKKNIIHLFFLTMSVFFILCFFVFSPDRLPIISETLSLLLLPSFCLMCVCIVSYIKIDHLFEQYLTKINLSRVYLDSEELKFISKFMEKEKLTEYLVENELKLSLKIANNVINSVYYQKKYTKHIANSIIDKLNLTQ